MYPDQHNLSKNLVAVARPHAVGAAWNCDFGT